MVFAHHAHMVAGAAGHDVDTVHCFDIVLAEGEVLKDRFPVPDAGGEAPAQGLGLLHDLLEHEVLVSALFGGIHLPVDGDNILVNGLHQMVIAPDALPCEDGQLSVLHVAHPSGVPQDGGDVAGDEIASLSPAQDQGAVLPDGHDPVGAVGTQDAQGVGPLDTA